MRSILRQAPERGPDRELREEQRQEQGRSRSEIDSDARIATANRTAPP
jgi:hypothetical protein